MRSNPAKVIEQWFSKYGDDSDCALQPRSAPYTVIGPAKPKGRIVFATKPKIVVAAIDESSEFASVGLIGRYGLPSRLDLTWIRAVIAKHELFFLGDMDPIDLMVFAWLRARLHPKRIRHLGISDAYLHQTQVQLPDSFIMRCSRSERTSLPVLRKVFPDLNDTLGINCARLLEQGRKIELDAVVSASETFASVLRPALASGKGRK